MQTEPSRDSEAMRETVIMLGGERFIATSLAR